MDSHTADLLERALAAYGGQERWFGARQVRARITATGMVFRAARSGGIHGATVVATLREQHCRLEPLGRPGRVAVLSGPRSWVEEGGVRTEWDGRRRRLVRWNETDLARFCTYAAWNYLTFPALLLRTDIGWRATGRNRLEATLPEGLVTHSRRQEFVLRPSGLLERHEYGADAAVPGASGVGRALEHATAGGIAFVSRRLVTPRLGWLRPPFPTLMQIQVSDFALE